jgi:hypothetical protein
MPDSEEDTWVPPTRNKVCLVLDAGRIQLLMGSAFHDDADWVELYRAYEGAECGVSDGSGQSSRTAGIVG